jgi:hypothetical protein
MRSSAVPDYPAATVFADERERVDRALEAVEDVRLAVAAVSNVLSYSLPQT